MAIRFVKGSPEREALKLTGVQAFFWIAWAVGSYQTIYLKGQGFSASSIGLVSALMSAVAIAAMTFWGMVSDKIGSVRRVNVILLAVGFGAFAAIPLLAGLPGASLLFMLFIPLSNFFKGPTTIFLDNLTVRNCSEWSLNYGVIRSGGSVAYAIVSLAVAANIDRIGVGNTFWLSALLMIIPAVLILMCAEPRGKRKMQNDAGPQKLPVGLLFRSPRYMAFLVFTVVFYVAVNFEGTFLPYYLDEMGIGSTRYGVLLAFRAFMEVPLLLGLTRLRRRFRMSNLIMVAAGLMALECLLFGMGVRSLVSAVLVCLLFGLGNGLYIGTSANYIYSLAPGELKATAQAVYASVLSASGIVGNLLGGVLFDALGARAFYLTTAVTFLGAVLIFAGSRMLGQKSAVTEAPAQA